MASTDGLVPITRAFLAKFYDKYPFDPVVPEISLLDSRMQVLIDQLDSERAKTEGGNDLLASLQGDIPHKIDENLWRNREQLEEISHLLEKEQFPASAVPEDTPQSKLLSDKADKWRGEIGALLNSIQEYQVYTSEKVFEMVLTYMPQDFRGTLIKGQRERSEKKRQLEVETLLKSGGSISQKYALLWQQQMDRRKTLASLGSATGVYRTLVKYLVGVPQVLLDFVKQINDHNGPMEEQRDRYGPHLYVLTAFVRKIRVFVALWWLLYDMKAENTFEFIGLVDEALEVYCKEFTRFLKTLRSVFENSPFLISAEDAMSVEEMSKAEEFKVVDIASGYKHEIPVVVEAEGSVVAWDFSLTYGKDVGFSVEYLDASGAKTGIVPYQRIENHQGSFNAPGVGSYTLIWDNTYSYLYKKTIRFKVDAIPPVVSAEEVEAEEALANIASHE